LCEAQRAAALTLTNSMIADKASMSSI
jgi:hypothetical protein